MTRKITKIVITLCLLVVLTAGLAAGAFADTADTLYAYMVPYTVESGDTLYSICSANGVDYDANSALICSFSGIGDARYIYAGATIWLPKTSKGSASEYYELYTHTVESGDTWYSLCNAYKISYGEAANRIKALNGSADMLYVGLTVKIPVFKGSTPKKEESSEKEKGNTPEKDAPEKPVDTSYKYLIPVTLKSGDTVGSVCNALGSDFGKFSAVIQKINGIADYRNLAVGRVIFIPSTKAPSAAGSYKIVEYTVKAGDTINDICNANNVKYPTVSGLIRSINTNLADPSYIWAGQKLLIPVPVNGAAAEEEQPGKTEKTAASSSIMILNSDDGLAISLVDGVHKTSTVEGTKVTVQASPKNGKTVDKITVTGYLSHKNITVTDSSFIMPDEAVEVNVSYK